MKNKLLFPAVLVLLLPILLMNSCNTSTPMGQDWTAVDQGAQWTDAVRNAYYTQDQGTRTIPYSWLTSLNDISGQAFLFDNLQRYGFLPIPGRKLPVGFALGRDTANILSAGMTCSACHTREIRIGDEKFRIDGAPAFVNTEAFTKDLEGALISTVSDQVKLEQFLDRIISASAANGDPAMNDRNALRSKVVKYQQDLTLFNQLSLPATNMWGVGRTDALNQIFNRVAGIDIAPNPDSMITSNIVPANSPVRFPFLWNMHLQDYTQWGGTSVNGNSNQALLRNTAECLGVGAQFRPVPNPSMPDGFDYLAVNTIDFNGLIAIEDQVKKIGPPKWPWSLDNGLVTQGANLFASNCASCHGISPGEPRPPSSITWATPVQDVGTDNWYFQTLSRTSSSGVLSPLLSPVVPTAVISKLVSQNILKQYDPSIAFITPTNSPGPGKYESRVLEGIWAAAPYLHNGSVPTLEDLLKPASQRPTTFYVGVNYDTLKVGMSIVQPLRVGYEYNTTIVGNSNAGHEYGTQFSPQDRAALLEYLKSL